MGEAVDKTEGPELSEECVETVFFFNMTRWVHL